EFGRPEERSGGSQAPLRKMISETGAAARPPEECRPPLLSSDDDPERCVVSRVDHQPDGSPVFLDPVRQLLRVAHSHANASPGRRRADRAWIVRSVDVVRRLAEVDLHTLHRVFRIPRLPRLLTPGPRRVRRYPTRVPFDPPRPEGALGG